MNLKVMIWQSTATRSNKSFSLVEMKWSDKERIITMLIKKLKTANKHEARDEGSDATKEDEGGDKSNGDGGAKMATQQINIQSELVDSPTVIPTSNHELFINDNLRYFIIVIF